MTNHARGSFDVKLTPDGPQDSAAGAALGRLSIAKQFNGDVEGTSTGQMLTAVTDVKGSAVYVAIERVDAALQGRRGTFVLMHVGRMRAGEHQLTITVVPDSAAGQLAGLSGTMTIDIAGGKHFYDLEYTLSDSRVGL